MGRALVILPVASKKVLMNSSGLSLWSSVNMNVIPFDDVTMQGRSMLRP